MGVAGELRPLAARDYDEWLPLWNDYLTFYETSLPEHVSRLTFARLTGGEEPMGGFIASTSGERACGIAHWITHRSCWTEGDSCYLQDLFVSVDHRGAGLGRRLIEAVYAAAAERGCSCVHWLTHETNAQAQLLYKRIGERSGFIQYRRVLAGDPSAC